MEFIELGKRKVARTKDSTDFHLPLWEIAFADFKTVTGEYTQYRVLYVTPGKKSKHMES